MSVLWGKRKTYARDELFRFLRRLCENPPMLYSLADRGGVMRVFRSRVAGSPADAVWRNALDDWVDLEQSWTRGQFVRRCPGNSATSCSMASDPAATGRPGVASFADAQALHLRLISTESNRPALERELPHAGSDGADGRLVPDHKTIAGFPQRKGERGGGGGEPALRPFFFFPPSPHLFSPLPLPPPFFFSLPLSFFLPFFLLAKATSVSLLPHSQGNSATLHFHECTL